MTTADQIIDAALTAFYQNGFHASGVDQLSAAAGVTKRTLYRHFQSKEGLIEAVLQWRDQQFMQEMQAEVEAEAPARRPLAYLAFLQRWGQRSQFNGCLFINAAAEYARASDGPHGQAKAHKARVQAYLLQLCRQAGLANASVLAAQLFVLGEGLIVASQVSGADAGQAAAVCAAWRCLSGDNHG